MRYFVYDPSLLDESLIQGTSVDSSVAVVQSRLLACRTRHSFVDLITPLSMFCLNRVHPCCTAAPPTVSCVAEEARARGNNGVTNVCVIAFAVLLFLSATPGLIAGARPASTPAFAFQQLEMKLASGGGSRSR